jgi:hypothetical protein
MESCDLPLANAKTSLGFEKNIRKSWEKKTQLLRILSWLAIPHAYCHFILLYVGVSFFFWWW